MTTKDPAIARMQTRHGGLVDRGRLASFCKHFHIRLLAVIHDVKPVGASANDWDMLVEFDAGRFPSRFELVGMEIELTRMVQRRVDLRTLDQLRLTTSRALLDAATPVFMG